MDFFILLFVPREINLIFSYNLNMPMGVDKRWVMSRIAMGKCRFTQCFNITKL